MIPSSDFGHALDLLFQARYYSLHSMQQAGIYKVRQSRAFLFISFHVFASLHQSSNKPCFLGSKNIVPDVIPNHQHLTGTQILYAQSCQGQMEKLGARLSHHLSLAIRRVFQSRHKSASAKGESSISLEIPGHERVAEVGFHLEDLR